HRLGLRFGDQHRRGSARDQRRGDDDVLLGDVFGDERGLLGLIFSAHRLGVAGGGFRLLEFLVLDRNELAAERSDLFFGGGTHVGGADYGAQTARRGDGLQTGNANAHDEHFRGGDGASGGHHHREGAAIEFRSFDYGAIAAEIGLA